MYDWTITVRDKTTGVLHAARITDEEVKRSTQPGEAAIDVARKLAIDEVWRALEIVGWNDLEIVSIETIPELFPGDYDPCYR